jgi:hypothetical protein
MPGWLWELIIAILAGGAAGALVSRWFRRRDQVAAWRALREVIAADIDSATEIARHNTRSAREPGENRPRAFIPFQTRTYELLLFNAEWASLANPKLIEDINIHLIHARHVNAMIARYEEMDVRHPHGSIWRAQATEYLKTIERYSDEQIPAALQKLRSAIRAV